MSNWQESDWAKAHEQGYSNTVWSITKDKAVRTRTLGEIRTALNNTQSAHPFILIPGCGSEAILENEIATKIKRRPDILCTDFEAVTKLAKSKSHNQQIVYEPRDSRNLGYTDAFDAVVVMNAVVAPTTGDNDKMLASFHEALKPGGTMLGLFPTIFCALDMSLTIERPEMKAALCSMVDLENGQVIDTSHDARQAFYTPLQLRKSLVAAGFAPEDIKMDVYFMNSPYFQHEAKRLYGLEPSEPPVYELFVTARKTAKPALAP